MSTKRLNRTILEGGRAHRSGKEYTRGERAALRAQMRRVTIDPEAADDEDPFAIRKSSHGDFTDQLSAVWRFLNSKDGELWSDVKSEIAHKFSVQSLSGYHIIKQHMMPEIKGAGSQETMYSSRYYNHDDMSRYRYYIDDENVFRVNKESYYYRRVKSKYPWNVFSSAQHEALEKWMGGWKIGKVGEILFWFRPTGMKARVYTGDIRTPDGIPEGHLAYGWYENVSGSHRQDIRLTKEEVEYFDSLPERIREGLLKAAPVYKEEEEAA